MIKKFAFLNKLHNHRYLTGHFGPVDKDLNQHLKGLQYTICNTLHYMSVDRFMPGKKNCGIRFVFIPQT